MNVCSNKSLPLDGSAQGIPAKWGKIVSHLERHWGETTVSAWLEKASVLEFSEEVLRIGVESDFKCEVLQKRCVPHIRRVLASWGNGAEVEIVVREEKETGAG